MNGQIQNEVSLTASKDHSIEAFVQNSPETAGIQFLDRASGNQQESPKHKKLSANVGGLKVNHQLMNRSGIITKQRSESML